MKRDVEVDFGVGSSTYVSDFTTYQELGNPHVQFLVLRLLG